MFCIISKRSILWPDPIDELSNRHRSQQDCVPLPLHCPQVWGWKEVSPVPPAVPPSGYRRCRQAGSSTQTALSLAHCPRLTPPSLMPATGTGGEKHRPLQGQRPLRGQHPEVWRREAPGERGLSLTSQQSWADRVSRAFPGAAVARGAPPSPEPLPSSIVLGRSLLPDVTRSEAAGSVQVTTRRP